MKKKDKSSTDLIPISSNGLVKTDISITLTKKLLAEHSLRARELEDTIPLSLLYKEPISGEYISIFKMGTPIPNSKTILIKCNLENQSIQLNIFQGEIHWDEKNIPVARIHIDNIQKQKILTIKYEFTFHIDINGILTVTANDSDTGKVQQIKIQAFEGLSQNDIKKLKDDADRSSI